jgi:hypothetical protein
VWVAAQRMVGEESAFSFLMGPDGLDEERLLTEM